MKKETHKPHIAMVVRSTIYSLVTLMPYSDHIPDPILGLLKTTTDPVQPEEKGESLPNPRQIIHSRMLSKRSEAQNEIHTSSDSGSTTLVESELTAGSAEDYHNATMQTYLEEQNCKFDRLIDKNLDAVLRQQTRYEEDTFWKGMIFDITQHALSHTPMSRASTIIGSAMKHALTFVPVSGDPTCDRVEIEERQAQLQEILGPLDHNTKAELLRQLYEDLGFVEQREQKLRELAHPEEHPHTFLAQMELLAILWVRLWFAGIRLFTPKAKSLYTKFKADELLFFNSKNLERAIMAMIKAMELVDEKLLVLPSVIGEKNLQSVASEDSPTFTNFEIPKAYRTSKTPEVGRPSFFEVAQQFASQIS